MAQVYASSMYCTLHLHCKWCTCLTCLLVVLAVATPGRAHCPVPLKLLANAECQLPHLGPADRWTGDWHRACALINSGNVDIFQIFHQNNGQLLQRQRRHHSSLIHRDHHSAICHSKLIFAENVMRHCQHWSGLKVDIHPSGLDRRVSV